MKQLAQLVGLQDQKLVVHPDHFVYAKQGEVEGTTEVFVKGSLYVGDRGTGLTSLMVKMEIEQVEMTINQAMWD